MLEVHAILQRQRCNENITKKTGTLSDAYHEALNHVDDAMKVTDMYLEKDYSQNDDANRRVITYVLTGDNGVKKRKNKRE